MANSRSLKLSSLSSLMMTKFNLGRADFAIGGKLGRSSLADFGCQSFVVEIMNVFRLDRSIVRDICLTKSKLRCFRNSQPPLRNFIPVADLVGSTLALNSCHWRRNP